YSREYEDLLAKAAGHLRRAAELTDNESLKKFLRSRADAFVSNDYYQSDVDWVRLKDHDIEVVIGPYEVYEDELMGYKGAFEAFITRVDPEESARLQKIGSSIAQLERHLPIADEHKGKGRSLESPIVVVQLIFSAGDSKAGVQTLAFNLPNDERVRNEEGSKKVLLKNVQHAKFEKILLPIAKEVMLPDQVSRVGFEPFFAHTLIHEISHGIGPGEIVKNGKKTTVNRELKDIYSVLEECKADTLGIYNLAYLIDKGFYREEMKKTMWPTYLAGMFRSVRFGINSAHGGGNAIQFNYILDKGGFVYDGKTGRFGVNEEKLLGAARDLAREILMIQAKGDYK
ncbi:MAG TPA: peptidase, partial [bacterium]|nr:peptidase [bacterium]